MEKFKIANIIVQKNSLTLCYGFNWVPALTPSTLKLTPNVAYLEMGSLMR